MPNKLRSQGNSEGGIMIIVTRVQTPGTKPLVPESAKIVQNRPLHKGNLDDSSDDVGRCWPIQLPGVWYQGFVSSLYRDVQQAWKSATAHSSLELDSGAPPETESISEKKAPSVYIVSSVLCIILFG